METKLQTLDVFMFLITFMAVVGPVAFVSSGSQLGTKLPVLDVFIFFITFLSVITIGSKFVPKAKPKKDIIDKRVVMPLSNPERASAHGVIAPHAIVLFGPPGTGKTTFARAIASRLSWPFVEIFPSRLTADSAGLAQALHDTFAQVDELEKVLVFIDEVEEIASAREGVSKSPAHGVTNELLKIIPAFRQRDTRLLVCATNSVRTLDQAFLRPGRFDYIIPIGPPDASARAAIWTSFVSRSSRADVNIDALVEASEHFTPADMEFASRSAAQASFEREMRGDTGETVGASTQDYLFAIGQTRRTVSDLDIQSFDEDIALFGRL